MVMQRFVKLVYYYQVTISVFLLTILLTYFNFPDISDTVQASKQDSKSANLMKSAPALKPIVCNSDKYVVMYSITEMQKGENGKLSEQPKQIADPRENAIFTLERKGTADGLSPVYSLTIHGNGSVIYEGIKNVDNTGIHRYNIPKDRAMGLVNDFKNVYYDGFKLKYSPSNDTNLLPVTTSIDWEGWKGKTDRVVNDHSDDVPPFLLTLENKIDQVANSKQWIGEHRVKK